MGSLQVVCASLVVALGSLLVAFVYPNYPSGRVGVLFYYYSRSTEGRRELLATKEGVSAVAINSDTPVVFIIHGYTESSFRSWVLNLTEAVLMHQPKSVVILVDYWDLTTISRPYMTNNVRHIGISTAKLIDLLVAEKGLKLVNTHVMGFSLGGRISGVIGNRVTSGVLGQITGLDASYPWLPPANDTEYLDASDAALVVNIRTSVLGSKNPPGHIDFLPNGGLEQPGCQHWYYTEPLKKVCNHYRSIFLMVEALKNSAQQVFPACGCPDWQSFQNLDCDCSVINHLSFSPNKSVRGTFYFATNSDEPYSKKLRHSPGQ